MRLWLWCVITDCAFAAERFCEEEKCGEGDKIFPVWLVCKTFLAVGMACFGGPCGKGVNGKGGFEKVVYSMAVGERD